MSFSQKAKLKSHSRGLLTDFRHYSVHLFGTLHIDVWQHFMRTVWTLTVTVHGRCLWHGCRSAKTLQSPPFLSRTPNSWRFLQQGQPFPLLSYISPPLDICQFYVSGLEVPVIVLQHGNDVNFPTGPFLWDVDSKAADNSCKDANTSHHLQNYFPAPQLCQLYPGEL